MPDYIAWTMLDGNVMCGRITGKFGTTLYVTRVDGGTCTVPARWARPASCNDVEAACRFFALIGK